jgi:hypothetical protein
MSLRKLPAAVMLLAISFSACEKETQQINKSKTALLTEGSWRLTEAYSDTEENGVPHTINVYDSLESCEKDNLTIFGTDNKVTIDEGPTKCDEFDPQKWSIEKWVLVSNTQLELTDIHSSARYEATILELSETRLHIRVSGTADDGNRFRNSFKYEKVQ